MFRPPAIILLYQIALFAGAAALAQEPDSPDLDASPFDAPAAPVQAPPAEPPAKSPARAGAATRPAEAVPRLETNPAVLSALEWPRKKPADYVQSILWLIDLGRPELAKPILDELTKLQLTDAQRHELVERFGSADMLKLARSKVLAPEGAAFADACMSAAAATTNEPQRIEALVKQLNDPSPEARLVARHDLAAIGTKAAVATLEAMARETDRDRRAGLAAGVVALHPTVDRMLLAMLETRDAALRADVADLLRHLRVPQAQPLFPASISTAEQELSTALSSYARGTPVFAADENNQVELWHWNDATRQLSSIRVPADDAQIIWMAKLAHVLSRLRPENPDYTRRATVLAWESALLNPATTAADPQQVIESDIRTLNGVLAQALKENYPHAAMVAISALSKRRDPSVLLTADGQPSPLADALLSSNRMVRFAALSAIMALDPQSPYPGSSRVPDALTWFARGSAERRALVAMPTTSAAADLAGQLMSQGFAAHPTNRGRDLVNMARETPDVEAIFVDADILLPNIRDVLYELRTNATTGGVPIAILAADGRLEAANRLAAEHKRTIAVPRLHTADVVANTTRQLAALAGRDALPPPDVRTAQATQAQAWLAKLASGIRPFYVIHHITQLSSRPPQATPLSNPPTQ